VEADANRNLVVSPRILYFEEDGFEASELERRNDESTFELSEKM